MQSDIGFHKSVESGANWLCRQLGCVNRSDNPDTCCINLLY